MNNVICSVTSNFGNNVLSGHLTRSSMIVCCKSGTNSYGVVTPLDSFVKGTGKKQTALIDNFYKKAAQLVGETNVQKFKKSVSFLLKQV